MPRREESIRSRHLLYIHPKYMYIYLLCTLYRTSASGKQAIETHSLSIYIHTVDMLYSSAVYSLTAAVAKPVLKPPGKEEERGKKKLLPSSSYCCSYTTRTLPA